MVRRYGYRNRNVIGREHLVNRTHQVPILDTRAVDNIARQHGYIKPNECPFSPVPDMTVEDEIYTAVTNIPATTTWYMTMNEIRTVINGELYVLNKITHESIMSDYIWYSDSWYHLADTPTVFIFRYTVQQFAAIANGFSSMLITDSGDGSWYKVINHATATQPVTLEYVKYSPVVDL